MPASNLPGERQAEPEPGGGRALLGLGPTTAQSVEHCDAVGLGHARAAVLHLDVHEAVLDVAAEHGVRRDEAAAQLADSRTEAFFAEYVG